MRLKGNNGIEDKMSSVRPAVKPRTILTGGGPQITEENSSSSEIPFKLENSSPVPNNSQVPFKPVPRKPRPKPRLTPHEEANEEDETPLPACFFEPALPKDPKRLTVNIFQRKIADPFDVDFEESIKDAALTTVDSEDSSPDQASTFFGSSVERDSIGDEPPTVYDNVPKVPRPDRRLHKMNSCPEAYKSERTSERFSRSSNITDSIYETITSYSSSESGLSDSNCEAPSMNWATFPSSKPEDGNEVVNKRLSGGLASTAFSSRPSSTEPLVNSTRNSVTQSTTLDTNISAKIEETQKSTSSLSVPGSNSIRRISGTGSPLNVQSKPKVHEYDEVAVDDGLVTIKRPNSVTGSIISENAITVANSDGSCLPTRNSVVMEFDPLCQQSIYNYVDVEDEETVMTSGNPSISTLDSGEVFIQQRLEVDNPEYFPGNIKEMPSDLKSSSSSFPKISDDDEEYEPVKPITPPRPISSSRDSGEFPLSKDDTRTSSMEDVTPRSSQKSPDSSQSNNFLRRLSNKLLQTKLNSIPENPKKPLDSVSSASYKCPRCFEEHTDNTRCKFVPTPRENVNYSSMLFKASGMIVSKRDFVKRFTVLSKGKLMFSTKPEKIVDTIILEKVVMISKRDDHRMSQSPHDLKCFQLFLGNGKNSSVILAGASEKDRSIWMQKLIEAFTYSFPSNIISSYDRAGWCFIKENLTGEWNPSWFVLSERKLYYAFNNSEDNYQLDLRKVREISSSSKGGKCPYVDNNEILTIHAITKILYVQTENAKVTATWEKAIRSASLFNGTHFDEMQLSTDDVPVVVEKCIDFLYAHGTLAEGIYRQSGANSRIAGLLEAFKKDAWSVQISLSDYSAHDVAGTLKRFFRTLPEPLVTDLLYDRWIVAYGLKTRLDKMGEYTKLLNELPQINYNILKKLFCHLHAVHEKQDKNLMPLDNLAPIWGPTLMSVDDGAENTSKLAQSYEIACAQCGVVRDLIENYYTLFRVDSQEIEREKRIQDGLEKFHLDSVRRKPSGDMRIFVYLHERDENTAISVILTPNATAQSIVQQIISTHCKRSGDNLSLHEVILGKRLERPLFPSEVVVETVLRWSIWEEEEKRTNYLILKKNTLYPALLPFAKDSAAMYGEFKYADSKSKSFRKYAFEFSGAKLKYYKDTKTTNELESWKIEDIIWYIGHEVKRVPPTRFNFTFVPRTYDFKRSKDEPYFGNVVSVNTLEELHKFIAAMIVGEHPEGLYPPVIL